MLKVFLLRKTTKLSLEQGFTMLEVLVAILMTTAFVATALQLMVINVAYKVKAQLQAQALFWVQEDQEEIMAMADSIAYDSSKCGSTNNYTTDLWKQLEPSSSSSFPANSDTTLLLNDTGPNDGSLQKPLLTGTTKNYQLQRTYKITKDDYEILVINYQVIDPTNNETLVNSNDETLVKTNFEVTPNAYNQCSK